MQGKFERVIKNSHDRNIEINLEFQFHFERPGLTRDTFNETPSMSTYLVAFIVSEFTIRENAQKTFNVYARPKAYSQTEYSFEIGQRTLAKFDELFDYKYLSVPGITKMSMAALPDFSAGAMENWGMDGFILLLPID